MVVKGKGILDATMSMAVSRGYLALALPVLTTLLCCLVTTEARASTMSTWEVRLDPVTGESVANFEIPASRLIRHGLERRESAGDGVADAPVSQVWRAREKELREHLENHLHISTDARTCAHGSFICREGEPPHACYILVRGVATVYRDTGRQRHVLGSLHEGELFGQVALLEHRRRSATVVADGDTVVVELGRGDFDKLINSSTPFALRFQEMVTINGIRQLRSANERYAA